MATYSPEQVRADKEKWQGIFYSSSILAILWWIISGGSAASWLIGLPAIALAVWAYHRLSTPDQNRISILGLIMFAPFFIWESIRGGIDVATRTLMPRLRIDPGFRRYHTTLRSQRARLFFTNCVSLMPGTMAADLEFDWLEIHVLNLSSDHQADLARLEDRVSRIFMESGEQADD